MRTVRWRGTKDDFNRFLSVECSTHCAAHFPQRLRITSDLRSHHYVRCHTSRSHCHTLFTCLFTTRGVLRSPICCLKNQLNLRKKQWGRDHILASSAKRRRVGRQPSNHSSQLIRSANSAERVQARPLIQQVRLLVQIGRGHPGRGKKKKKRFGQHSTFMKLLPASTTAPQSRSPPCSTPRSRIHSLRSGRRPSTPPFLPSQIEGKKCAHVRSVDVSGRERVDAYPLGSEFARHASSHLQHCRFARVI